MGIGYLDDIAFQNFAENDNGTGFLYALAEDETLPIPHPDSFQAFFRIEIGYEVRKDDNTFPEIEERDVRGGKKHQIKFFLGKFIRKQYLFP